jgi:hypothetical protein
MKRATAEVARQVVKREPVFDILLDIAADRANECRLWVAIGSLGAAAETGTESGMLGVNGAIEKAHVLAAGTPRWARRAAEYASARNGENESAVERGIAGKNGLPAAVVSVGAGFHDFPGKYRIGCHGKKI